jgi:uncharacterized delta-60 repeat protein
VTIKYNTGGEEQWISTYEGLGEAKSIAVDASGNVYVAGHSYSELTDFDFTTIKYNSEGVEQRKVQYDGPGNSWDFVESMVGDDEGNIYVTGWSVGSETGFDYATIKYKSSCEELWVARYDGPGNEEDVAFSIAVDDSDNVYVTGMSEWDYATVKYNPEGIEQWVARYSGLGDVEDMAYSIAVDGEGNVYTTGRSEGPGMGYDYVTVKYNSIGEEQWVAQYNGPGNQDDVGCALVVDNEGNCYVTGYSYSSGAKYDYATIKYNSIGEEQWVARYNGSDNYNDYARNILIDGLGNVYVTGVCNESEDLVTIKYSADGEEQWVVNYSNLESSVIIIDRPTQPYLTLDRIGNVYVAGYSWTDETRYDYVTVKYNQGTGITEASVNVSEYHLEVPQLTPVPTISYTLLVSTHVSLKLYDVTGQLVETLVAGNQSAGTHTIYWDTRDQAGKSVSAGLYFVLLQTPNHSATSKLVVAR